MSVEAAEDKTGTITVTVPIREKKEYRLDNGMILEKWTKVSQKDFEVNSDQVTEEDAESKNSIDN